MQKNMEEDSSNDVVEVETPKDYQLNQSKPLLNLFQRLIGNNIKQNTVLTNAQILDILKKDFEIDVNKLYELEVDVYLSVMKRFLKLWPQWDEFDKLVHELRKKNDKDEIDTVLNSKYNDLKEYLLAMLEKAKPLAKEAARKVDEKLKKEPKIVDKKISNVVLEVQCSRQQLNNLFFRHPHPDQEFSVFNQAVNEPARITLENPDYDAILNWWDIAVTVKAGNYLHFKRSTEHEVKHRLINKKNHYQTNLEPLPSCFQERACSYCRGLMKSTLLNMLEKIMLKSSIEYRDALRVIVQLITKDMEELSQHIKSPAAYRKYFSKYPYVRYLYTEVPEAKGNPVSEKYDLRLEEVISPIYQMNIGKVEPDSNLMANTLFLKSECRACEVKYSGPDMLERLKQHVLSAHAAEPDWRCSRCLEPLPMAALAGDRWRHQCLTSE